MDQLHRPTNVIVDQETDTLLICDSGNRRVMRWPRRRFPSSNSAQSEVVVDSVACFGLTMDDRGALYVSDTAKDEVKRYNNRGQHTQGTIVAGGRGSDTGLHQLNTLTYLFVDTKSTLYVFDMYNHRVVKWLKEAATVKERIEYNCGIREGYGWMVVDMFISHRSMK